MQSRATYMRQTEGRGAVLGLSRPGAGRSPCGRNGTAGKEEERCACPGTRKGSKGCWRNQVESKVQKDWGQTLRILYTMQKHEQCNQALEVMKGV